MKQTAPDAPLRVPSRYLSGRGIRKFKEARRLAYAGLGADGRDKFLIPAAARAWRRMQAAAARRGVTLTLISAFRSVAYQTALIRAKVAQGRTLADVLKVNAPPGYSEHHTGRAVDIGTPGCAALDEAFEKTPAFAWLERHAARYGFFMSYPRGNRQGYDYEPWHWRYR